MTQTTIETWSDFPALDLVRSSRFARMVARVTFVVLILSILGMLLLPWQQTAAGNGMVLAKNPQERPQAVKSPIKGIVKYVKPGLMEGSFVTQGDILLELEPAAEGGIQQLDFQNENARLQVEYSKQQVEFAKQQVDLQLASGKFMEESLQKELEAAETKWRQAQSELSGLEAELVDKKNKRTIAEDVFKKGLVSREELVSKQQDEATQVQKVQKASQAVEEALAILEAKRKEVDSKLGEIEIKNRDAQNKYLAEQDKLQSALKGQSDLRLKRQELDRLTIRAPRTGLIQKWFGLEGSDTVKEADELFVLVPQTQDLAVEMMIDGNDMPLIKVGDPVRLQFEGWPAVQFVGWPSVAVGTFGGTVNRVFPTDDGKGNFRVLVVPENHLAHDDGWPDERFLRQGVQVNGWVLLNQVTLGYEIWRQINGFPPALSEQDTKVDKGVKKLIPKL
jgi:multidrug resistance efflux pump